MPVVRRLQAVACELLIGIACIVLGIAALIPGPSLLYRMVQESGVAVFMALTMVAAGTMVCWGAVRSNRHVRVVGAIVSNIVWFSLGFMYVIGGQYGPVMFLSVVFFTFTCLISMENWE